MSVIKITLLFTYFILKKVGKKIQHNSPEAGVDLKHHWYFEMPVGIMFIEYNELQMVILI